MKMLTRFTWTNWAKGTVLQQGDTIWHGEHDGYKRLADPVDHNRRVLSLGEDRWVIVDRLRGKQQHHYALHWLLNDVPYEQRDNFILLLLDSGQYKVQVGLLDGQSAFSVLRGDSTSTRGWRARYYGEKEPAISILLETNRPRACFWTFFGFEEDLVEMARNELQIKFNDREITIDLAEPNK
jgi:hypothetical protein